MAKGVRIRKARRLVRRELKRDFGMSGKTYRSITKTIRRTK